MRPAQLCVMPGTLSNSSTAGVVDVDARLGRRSGLWLGCGLRHAPDPGPAGPCAAAGQAQSQNRNRAMQQIGSGWARTYSLPADRPRARKPFDTMHGFPRTFEDRCKASAITATTSSWDHHAGGLPWPEVKGQRDRKKHPSPPANDAGGFFRVAPRKSKPKG